MLAEALQAEVDAYIAQFIGERDEHGRRLVVRNGTAPAPRGPDQRRRGRGDRAAGERPPDRPGDRGAGRGSPRRSCRRGAARPRRSPRCCRCCTCTGCRPGTSCPRSGSSWARTAGLSASVITQVDRDLEGRAARLRRPGSVRGGLRLPVGRRDPRQHPAGGAQAVPAGHDRVRADGRKELVALTDGYRESTESWADLLRDCARRGMRAPVLAMGDGALGFWGALREVFPQAGSSAVGSTRSPTFLVRCPSPRIRGRRRRSRRSGTLRTAATPSTPSRRSRPPTGRSSPRPSRRSPTTSRSCSRSTTTPPSTGSTCAPRMKSSTPSPAARDP